MGTCNPLLRLKTRVGSGISKETVATMEPFGCHGYGCCQRRGCYTEMVVSMEKLVAMVANAAEGQKCQLKKVEFELGSFCESDLASLRVPNSVFKFMLV